MKTKVCLKYFVNDCGYQISLRINNPELLDQICSNKVLKITTKKSEYLH